MSVASMMVIPDSDMVFASSPSFSFLYFGRQDMYRNPMAFSLPLVIREISFRVIRSDHRYQLSEHG